jgi:hypothetical protein
MTNSKPSTFRRTRLRTLLAGAVLMAASAPSLAIEPFTADYQATYMGVQANGRMSLTAADNNRWTYSLDITNALASLSQTTVFEERGGQWRPLSSSDSAKVLVKKSDKTATYDWAHGEARWSGDVKPDRSGPVRLQAGDMDALLINLALVRDHEAGKPLNYRMVDDGRIKQLRYREVGQEQIDVGGQRKQATKLVHDDGDKQTIVWLVDGMPVPARIQQRKDGKDSIDLTVRSVN